MTDRIDLRHLLSGLGLAVLVVLAFGSVGDKTSPEDAAAGKEVIEAHYQDLASIHELIATGPESWEAQECDKALMAQRLGQPEGDLVHLTRFYAPYLERFAAGTETAWNRSMGDWEWLTDESVVEHYKRVESQRPFELKSQATYWIPRVTEERFAAIIYPTSEEFNRFPVIEDDGESFSGGMFAGWLLVADVVEPEIICRAPIAAANSGQVRRGLNNTMELAVARDFQDNFEKALAEKLPDGVVVSW